MNSEIYLFIKDIVLTVVGYLKADWSILLVGVMIAVLIKTYIDDQSFKKYINQHSKVSIGAAIGFGAFTPLCACGTMAVILSMFISSMPWGPVMAFLVSSPLTSPSEFVFQSTFLGVEFAVVVLIASIVLGVTAGGIAHYLSVKTSFFKDQFRIKAEPKVVPKTVFLTEPMTEPMTEPRIESKSNLVNVVQFSEIPVKEKSLVTRFRLKAMAENFYDLGIKKVLFYFVIFIAIGRIVELIIPQQWILSLFGENNSYSVPLGATIGLPLYVSSSAALPLMKSFLTEGASQGAILAFLITGKATGVPVIAGMSAILKKRAILYYVLTVYIGGIVFGWLYEFYLRMV